MAVYSTVYKLNDFKDFPAKNKLKSLITYILKSLLKNIVIIKILNVYNNNLNNKILVINDLFSVKFERSTNIKIALIKI